MKFHFFITVVEKFWNLDGVYQCMRVENLYSAIVIESRLTGLYTAIHRHFGESFPRRIIKELLHFQ